MIEEQTNLNTGKAWSEMDEADLRSEVKRKVPVARVFAPGYTVNWGAFDNNFMFAFSHLISAFQTHKALVPELAEGGPVEFVFDRQSAKSIILAGWDAYVENRHESIRDQFGTAPRFEDDEEFLPLQAADFLAWWIRYWHEGKWHEADGDEGWKLVRKQGQAGIRSIDMSLDEDGIAQALRKNLHRMIGAGSTVYDVTFSYDAPPL